MACSPWAACCSSCCSMRTQIGSPVLPVTWGVKVKLHLGVGGLGVARSGLGP